MFWYRVDMEIFLFGKESEIIEADSAYTAEIIATKKVVSKFGITEKDIINISSAKLNY